MEIIGLKGLPDVVPGNDLAELIVKACEGQGLCLKDRDILIITQKIVSKAENRVVHVEDVIPSKHALEIARSSQKDPILVEVVLGEAKRIVKMVRDIIITQTKHGFVCANSGVDTSNLEKGTVSILPIDPDNSARNLRSGLKERLGIDVAVVITDTFARPWRTGQVDVAIGVAGLKPILNYRGKKDQYGNLLTVTEVAVADELASAGELVKGKSSRIPVAIVRGYVYEKGVGSARELVRKTSKDIFL